MSCVGAFSGSPAFSCRGAWLEGAPGPMGVGTDQNSTSKVPSVTVMEPLPMPALACQVVPSVPITVPLATVPTRHAPDGGDGRPYGG